VSGCYKPINEYAYLHNLKFKGNTAFAYFGRPQQELLGPLSQLNAAPINVPLNLTGDLFRLSDVAYGVGWNMYLTAPMLAQELKSVFSMLDKAGASTTYLDVGGMRLLSIFEGWLHDIFAHTIGAMLLGPAYLLAKVSQLQSKRNPREVITIETRGHQGVGGKPPAHITIFIISRVLSEIGYKDLSTSYWNKWVNIHETALTHDRELETLDRFFISILGRVYGYIPRNMILSLCGTMVESVLESKLNALGGYQLNEMRQIQFTKQHQIDLDDAVNELRMGKIAQVEMRVVIAAAIYAYQKSPALRAKIVKTLMASFGAVGVGRTRRRAAAPVGSRDFFGPQAILEAVILREALTKKFPPFRSM